MDQAQLFKSLKPKLELFFNDLEKYLKDQEKESEGYLRFIERTNDQFEYKVGQTKLLLTAGPSKKSKSLLLQTSIIKELSAPILSLAFKLDLLGNFIHLETSDAVSVEEEPGKEYIRYVKEYITTI